tara:strand:+ start:320 stop:451 length:132 start_codon:yes stop_codon:yes gene_type:complete
MVYVLERLLRIALLANFLANFDVEIANEIVLGRLPFYSKKKKF